MQAKEIGMGIAMNLEEAHVRVRKFFYAYRAVLFIKGRKVMNNNITFFQKHPLASYFFLAFMIAWVGSFVAVGPKFLAGETIVFADIGLMALPMLGAPSLSGILMAYLVDGRQGLSDLFARMKKWRVDGRWYTPLLIFPSLILALSLVLSTFVSAEFTPIFFPFGILMGLFAGLLEETGWMGYAFPKMILKRSILANSIYLGFIHGIWHMVASFIGSSSTLGEFWLPYFISSTLFIMALRVLIVWVYANTKSLLLSQLMHASSTGFLAVFVSTEIAPTNWFIFYITYAFVLWAVVSVVIVKYGKNLVKSAS